MNLAIMLKYWES